MNEERLSPIAFLPIEAFIEALMKADAILRVGVDIDDLIQKQKERESVPYAF